MTDRAGPPTPRNEPYRAPDAVNLAFKKWLDDTGRSAQGYDIGQRHGEKTGFFAGWNAVNQPQNNLKKSIDTALVKDE